MAMGQGQGQVQQQQQQEESVEMSGGKKIRYKLKEWNQRRKSFALQRKFSSSINSINGGTKGGTHSIADSDFVGVSHVNDNDIPFRLNASFFKNVNDNSYKNDNNKLSIDNVKNVKEMQFLSQQLTNDVANKTQSIQDLGIANAVLFEQMEKMKNVMEQMKDE
eukprot:UN03070